MAAVSRVILFDIDGTLIHSGRAGVRGMNAAFEHLYGVKDALAGVTLAGRTDHAIVSDVLRAIGRDATPAAVHELRDVYVGHLALEVTRPEGEAGVLPGVGALLDALAGRQDAAVGLLTGNFARGAAIKLGHYALWPRFGFGAFGDDHVDRRDLMPIAIAEAARAGLSLPSSSFVVVGDTPHDIDCARAHGAKSIGVATGPFSREALEAAGADLAVDTLEDAARLLRWLA